MNEDLKNALRLLEQARDTLRHIHADATMIDTHLASEAAALVNKIDRAGLTFPPPLKQYRVEMYLENNHDMDEHRTTRWLEQTISRMRRASEADGVFTAVSYHATQIDPDGGAPVEDGVELTDRFGDGADSL